MAKLFVDQSAEDRLYNFEMQNVFLTNVGPSHYGMAGKNRFYVVYDTARRIDIYEINKKNEMDFDQSFPIIDSQIEQVIFCDIPSFFVMIVGKNGGKAVHVYTNFGPKLTEIISNLKEGQTIEKNAVYIRRDAVIYDIMNKFEKIAKYEDSVPVVNKFSNYVEEVSKKLGIIEFRNPLIATEVKFINTCQVSGNLLILLRNKALLYEHFNYPNEIAQLGVLDFVPRKIIHLPWEPEIGRITYNYITFMSASHISMIRINFDNFSLVCPRLKRTDDEMIYPSLLDKTAMSQENRHARSVYGPISPDLACKFGVYDAETTRLDKYLPYDLLYCHRFFNSKRPPSDLFRALNNSINYRLHSHCLFKEKQMGLHLDKDEQTYGCETVPLSGEGGPLLGVVLYVFWKNDVTCHAIEFVRDHLRLVPLSKVTLQPSFHIRGFTCSIYEDLIHLLSDESYLDTYVSHTHAFFVSTYWEKLTCNRPVKRMFRACSNRFMNTMTLSSNTKSVFVVSKVLNQRSTIYNLLRPHIDNLHMDLYSKIHDIYDEQLNYIDDVLVRDTRIPKPAGPVKIMKTIELPKVRKEPREPDPDNLLKTSNLISNEQIRKIFEAFETPNDYQAFEEIIAKLKSELNISMKKKPDEKKPDQKKPEEKKPDGKKPDPKKTDEKKPNEKKPDEKKPEEKPDEKKPDEKQPDEKQPDEEKTGLSEKDKDKPEEVKEIDPNDLLPQMPMNAEAAYEDLEAANKAMNAKIAILDALADETMKMMDHLPSFIWKSSNEESKKLVDIVSEDYQEFFEKLPLTDSTTTADAATTLTTTIETATISTTTADTATNLTTTIETATISTTTADTATNLTTTIKKATTSTTTADTATTLTTTASIATTSTKTSDTATTLTTMAGIATTSTKTSDTATILTTTIETALTSIKTSDTATTSTTTADTAPTPMEVTFSTSTVPFLKKITASTTMQVAVSTSTQVAVPATKSVSTQKENKRKYTDSGDTSGEENEHQVPECQVVIEPEKEWKTASVIINIHGEEIAEVDENEEIRPSGTLGDDSSSSGSSSPSVGEFLLGEIQHEDDKNDDDFKCPQSENESEDEFDAEEVADEEMELLKSSNDELGEKEVAENDYGFVLTKEKPISDDKEFGSHPSEKMSISEEFEDTNENEEEEEEEEEDHNHDHGVKDKDNNEDKDDDEKGDKGMESKEDKFEESEPNADKKSDHSEEKKSDKRDEKTDESDNLDDSENSNKETSDIEENKTDTENVKEMGEIVDISDEDEEDIVNVYEDISDVSDDGNDMEPSNVFVIKPGQSLLKNPLTLEGESESSKRIKLDDFSSSSQQTLLPGIIQALIRPAANVISPQTPSNIYSTSEGRAQLDHDYSFGSSNVLPGQPSLSQIAVTAELIAASEEFRKMTKLFTDAFLNQAAQNANKNLGFPLSDNQAQLGLVQPKAIEGSLTPQVKDTPEEKSSVVEIESSTIEIEELPQQVSPEAPNSPTDDLMQVSPEPSELADIQLPWWSRVEGKMSHADVMEVDRHREVVIREDTSLPVIEATSTHEAMEIDKSVHEYDTTVKGLLTKGKLPPKNVEIGENIKEGNKELAKKDTTGSKPTIDITKFSGSYAALAAVTGFAQSLSCEAAVDLPKESVSKETKQAIKSDDCSVANVSKIELTKATSKETVKRLTSKIVEVKEENVPKSTAEIEKVTKEATQKPTIEIVEVKEENTPKLTTEIVEVKETKIETKKELSNEALKQIIEMIDQIFIECRKPTTEIVEDDEPTDNVENKDETKQFSTEDVDVKDETKQPTTDVEFKDESKKPTAEQVEVKDETKQPTAEDVGGKDETKQPTAEDAEGKDETKQPTSEDAEGKDETKQPTSEDVEVKDKTNQPTSEDDEYILVETEFGEEKIPRKDYKLFYTFTASGYKKLVTFRGGDSYQLRDDEEKPRSSCTEYKELEDELDNLEFPYAWQKPFWWQVKRGITPQLLPHAKIAINAEKLKLEYAVMQDIRKAYIAEHGDAKILPPILQQTAKDDDRRKLDSKIATEEDGKKKADDIQLSSKQATKDASMKIDSEELITKLPSKDDSMKVDSEELTPKQPSKNYFIKVDSEEFTTKQSSEDNKDAEKDGAKTVDDDDDNCINLLKPDGLFRKLHQAKVKAKMQLKARSTYSEIKRQLDEQFEHLKESNSKEERVLRDAQEAYAARRAAIHAQDKMRINALFDSEGCMIKRSESERKEFFDRYMAIGKAYEERQQRGREGYVNEINKTKEEKIKLDLIKNERYRKQPNAEHEEIKFENADNTIELPEKVVTKVNLVKPELEPKGEIIRSELENTWNYFKKLTIYEKKKYIAEIRVARVKHEKVYIQEIKEMRKTIHKDLIKINRKFKESIRSQFFKKHRELKARIQENHSHRLKVMQVSMYLKYPDDRSQAEKEIKAKEEEMIKERQKEFANLNNFIRNAFVKKFHDKVAANKKLANDVIKKRMQKLKNQFEFKVIETVKAIRDRFDGNVPPKMIANVVEIEEIQDSVEKMEIDVSDARNVDESKAWKDYKGTKRMKNVETSEEANKAYEESDVSHASKDGTKMTVSQDENVLPKQSSSVPVLASVTELKLPDTCDVEMKSASLKTQDKIKPVVSITESSSEANESQMQQEPEVITIEDICEPDTSITESNKSQMQQEPEVIIEDIDENEEGEELRQVNSPMSVDLENETRRGLEHESDDDEEPVDDESCCLEINSKDFYCELNTDQVSYLDRLRQPYYYLYALCRMSTECPLKYYECQYFYDFAQKMRKQILERFPDAEEWDIIKT